MCVVQEGKKICLSIRRAHARTHPLNVDSTPHLLFHVSVKGAAFSLARAADRFSFEVTPYFAPPHTEKPTSPPITEDPGHQHQSKRFRALNISWRSSHLLAS